MPKSHATPRGLTWNNKHQVVVYNNILASVTLYDKECVT